MRKPLVIRRVVGSSMSPTLPANRLIIASGFFRRLKSGDIVIFKHQGLDKIKRIKDMRTREFYVLGDNASESNDSRVFGWLPNNTIIARVIWPRTK